MPKFQPIFFDPDLLHTIALRHGPRLHAPQQGDVWDFDCPLSPNDVPLGRLTVETYFGDRSPAFASASLLDRAVATIRNRWPNVAVEEDARLGPTRDEIPLWAKIDAIPNTYDATAQQCYEADPPLLAKAGQNFFTACKDAAFHAGTGGKFASTGSHFGNADTGVRFARLHLGVDDNDGWLPGRGFGTGAFAHLSWIPSGRLVYCRYYPVPQAD